MKRIDDILDMFGLDKSPIVGLDIGSTGVKILSLIKEGDKIIVDNYAIEPLEPGIVVEKNVLNRDRVTQAIRDAVAKTNIVTKKVSLALASAMSITRVVQFGAELNDKEIGDEIHLAADRYIPYPLHEVSMDYKVIGPNAENAELVDILIVASKSDNVNNLEDIIKDAGLKPEIVDIDSYALARSFKSVTNKLPDHGKDKVVALFDIGATTTTFIVLKNDQLLYTREQAFGSQQLVDEVQNIYGLNYDEAILAIKFEDLPKDYDTDILDPFKQTVAQQINRFCQFFYSAGDYSTVDYIFITGGCTAILGIDVTVQNKMGIKTFVVDPFADMEISANINKAAFKADSARLMNCCGLALRNVTAYGY